jgi:hypothetical protein
MKTINGKRKNSEAQSRKTAEPCRRMGKRSTKQAADAVPVEKHYSASRLMLLHFAISGI